MSKIPSQALTSLPMSAIPMEDSQVEERNIFGDEESAEKMNNLLQKLIDLQHTEQVVLYFVPHNDIENCPWDGKEVHTGSIFIQIHGKRHSLIDLFDNGIPEAENSPQVSKSEEDKEESFNRFKVVAKNGQKIQVDLVTYEDGCLWVSDIDQDDANLLHEGVQDRVRKISTFKVEKSIDFDFFSSSKFFFRLFSNSSSGVG